MRAFPSPALRGGDDDGDDITSAEYWKPISDQTAFARLRPPSSNAVPVGAPPTKISHRAPLPRVSTGNPTLRVRDGGWMGHQRNENGAVQLSSKNPHKVALKEEEEEEEGVTQPLEESLASLRRKERSACGSE